MLILRICTNSIAMMLVVSLLLIGRVQLAYSASALTLYVAPNGNDSNSGTEQAQPLQTLKRALALYESSEGIGHTRIVIATGIYKGERVKIKRLSSPLTIEGDTNNRPVFLGTGDGTWLMVDSSEGKILDLSIVGIEVRDYQSAISLNGDRRHPERWLGGVRILQNKFVSIGSLREGQRPATAAIRLVNARSNLIRDNEFERIRNLVSCGGMHSIYMASMSSDNQVIGNRFVDGCGDTIKVRDESNANRVEKNRFERQEGASFFLDSFCDKQIRDDCTKPEGECPSWGNVFDHNFIGGLGNTNKKTVTARKIASDLSTICPPPPLDQIRIRDTGTSR